MIQLKGRIGRSRRGKIDFKEESTLIRREGNERILYNRNLFEVDFCSNPKVFYRVRSRGANDGANRGKGICRQRRRRRGR